MHLFFMEDGYDAIVRGNWNVTAATDARAPAPHAAPVNADFSCIWGAACVAPWGAPWRSAFSRFRHPFRETRYPWYIGLETGGYRDPRLPPCRVPEFLHAPRQTATADGAWDCRRLYGGPCAQQGFRLPHYYTPVLHSFPCQAHLRVGDKVGEMLKDAGIEEDSLVVLYNDWDWDPYGDADQEKVLKTFSDKAQVLIEKTKKRPFWSENDIKSIEKAAHAAFEASDKVGKILVDAGFPKSKLAQLYESWCWNPSEYDDQKRAVKQFADMIDTILTQTTQKRLFTPQEIICIEDAACAAKFYRS